MAEIHSDLDDHVSALHAATSTVWNGTGERSLDPMELCHLSQRTASETAPRGAEPALPIAQQTGLAPGSRGSLDLEVVR